ncbi:MAG: glycosyl hydrolase, partial [Kiritimatiellales bacterium]
MKKSIIPFFAGLFFSAVLAGEISAVKPLGDKENRGVITNNFTMAGWVQPDAGIRLTPPSGHGISATKGQKYILFPDPGHKQYGDGHSGTGISVGTNGVMVIEHSSEYFSPVLTWTHPVAGRTHVAVVYRDGSPALFINGEKAEAGISSGRIVHPGALKAGPPNDRFTGEMTRWAVYGQALGDAQVKQLAEPVVVTAPASVIPVQAPMVSKTPAVKNILSAGGDVFSDAFCNPADSTRPGVYWYWLGGIISKEGITKDLEAMKRVGIGRAYIGNINSPMEGLVSVKMFSDEWWELTRHAIREGGRLGIDIGVFNCPGWSQSGGPWVKPEQSMRYLAVSETKVSGPGKFSAVLPVPAQPFQDVAVLAVPEEPQDPAAAILAKSKVTTSPAADGAAMMLDGDSETAFTFPAGAATKQPFIVEIKCPEEVTVRNITIVPDKVQLKAECELQYKDQVGQYQPVKKFTMERLSKINIGPMLFGPVVEAFPAVKAAEFRVIFTQLAKGGKKDKDKDPGIAEISLSESPKLERYVEKQLGQAFPTPHTQWDAYLWKPPAAADDGTSAVKPAQIQNISASLDSAGKLIWEIPAGNWTILRVGMSPTGVQNNSAPKEGKGMETDKMNAAHVKAHFNAYLGKLAERLSPEERKGWKYVVVDSYEVGPQNWTDNLQNEFRARYHYDPLPWFPVLTGRVVDNPDRSDRFLWDLRRLAADKVASDYIKPLRESANEHGLKLWMENYGHFGFPGEDLQYGGQSDEVSGEFWASGDLGSFELRTASSSAHTY